MTHFLAVTRAANLLLHNFRAPNLVAAGPAGALHLDGTAATWLVDAAATAGIPFPRTGIADTLINNRPRNVLRNGFPFAAANVNPLGFRHRLANRVTAVAIARFGYGLVGCAADIAVASLVARLADRVAAVAIARLVARLADRVAAVAITGLVARLSNLAADIAVASLVTRLADGVAAVAIARLVARLADRVTLITIASLVHVLVAGHRDLLADLVVDGLAAGVVLLFPNYFFNSLVARLAALLRGAIVTIGSTRLCRTAAIAGSSAVTRDGTLAGACDHQQSGKDGDPLRIFHRYRFLKFLTEFAGL
jgi:hypothetical protein